MKRTDIQALRGFSVLAVLLYHLQIHQIKGGFLGVDIFFVISGFVITERLARGEGSFRRQIADFYRRRAKRILPASLFTIVLTALLSRIFLAPISLATFSRDGLAATLFAGNFRFAAQGNNYLNQTLSPTPYLHYWSLGVEEQFYLIWPILFLLFLKNRKRLVLPLFIAATAFALWYTHISAVNAFYLPISRAWEFLAGIVVALLIPRAPRKGEYVAVAGWITVLLSILFIGSDLAVPGVTTLIPVAGAMAILIARSTNSAEPILAWFGDHSFSIYLIHWPLIVFALARHDGLTLSAKVVLATASIGLGYLISRYVERPFRFNGRLSLSLGNWAVAITVIAALLAAGSSIEAASAKNSTLVIDRSVPVIYKDGCHLDFTLSQPKSHCLFGDLTSTVEVVLTGDSHAAQWFNAVEEAALKNHWKLLVLTKSSCPAVLMATKRNGVADTACAAWQKYVAARIAAEKPARVIITNYSESAYPLVVSGDYSQIYSRGEAKFIQALGLPQSSIYLIEDTPAPHRSMPECLSQHSEKVSACNFPLHRSVATLATRDLVKASGFHYLDLTGELCPGGVCQALYKGINTYRDGSHISVSTSKALATQMEKFLN
jgi:peptidoglycan/LPS O-acetylase OafA/YrhL